MKKGQGKRYNVPLEQVTTAGPRARVRWHCLRTPALYLPPCWRERRWVCGVGGCSQQRRSPLAQGLWTQMLSGVECLQVVE